jgi:PhnB protein
MNMAVHIVPEELRMMSIRLNPYLILNGNAREAVHFYEKALGGKVSGIMKYGDMPENPEYPLTDEMKDLVMHAHLKVGESDLMFSDNFPGIPYQQGDTVQVAVHPKDEAEAKAVFAALEEGGHVIMPLQKTEWSPLYGSVKDKFGVTFQVNVQGDQP